MNIQKTHTGQKRGLDMLLNVSTQGIPSVSMVGNMSSACSHHKVKYVGLNFNYSAMKNWNNLPKGALSCSKAKVYIISTLQVSCKKFESCPNSQFPVTYRNPINCGSYWNDIPILSYEIILLFWRSLKILSSEMNRGLGRPESFNFNLKSAAKVVKWQFYFKANHSFDAPHRVHIQRTFGWLHSSWFEDTNISYYFSKDFLNWPFIASFYLLKANVTTALAACHCVKLLALSSLWKSIPMVTLQILMATSFQHNKLNIRCLSHLSSSSINIVSYWNFSHYRCYWNHTAIKEQMHNTKAGQRKP